MSVYIYTAMDGKGREQKGTVHATSEEEAVEIVKKLGLFPTSVAERQGRKPAPRGASAGTPAGGAFSVFAPKIRRSVLCTLTRQLATMLDAGMPLLRALRFLEKQAQDNATRGVLRDLSGQIESGSRFSDALATHPRSFGALYVNMVRAGEASGSLEGVLKRQAEYMEKARRLRKKVRSAMTYPAAVCVVALAITSGLMIFIVPKFAQMFTEMLQGHPLPLLTRGVLRVSNFMSERTLAAAAIAIGLIVALQLFRRTRFGEKMLDTLVLRVPVFGHLARLSASAQFCRVLGTLMRSGVPVLNALSIVRNTATNRVVANTVQCVHDAVKEGDNMSVPLSATRVFPPMLVGMVEVGEETGALPEMLGRVAETYEEEVDNAVEAMTSLIEPAMILFLAIVIGTIVVALFLPLIVLISVMG